MWQFVFSNASPDDPTVSPTFPAQPEQGDLATLVRAIENGADIRIGMLRAGTIHYSVFPTESVRYWTNGTRHVAIATFPVCGSNVNYDPTESDPRFGPWYAGISANIFHSPGIVIVDSDGHERFFFRDNPVPWVSPTPRVYRWYADL